MESRASAGACPRTSPALSLLSVFRCGVVTCARARSERGKYRSSSTIACADTSESARDECVAPLTMRKI
eukprot:6196401-Pleurochrysis_carterae.AAC.1